MADVRFIKARGNSRRRDSRSRTPYEARPGDLCLGLAREVGALGVQPGRSTESLAGARTVDYSHARGSVQSGDAPSSACPVVPTVPVAERLRQSRRCARRAGSPMCTAVSHTGSDGYIWFRAPNPCPDTS